ncbi:DUF4091 domain-containing protein [Fulvivirgaceae bacterium BMA10]|uniref:DUF4091 domain-containing protein n=1 Tax=Splendidivirga corallicola TaxID=3051826 RepID=A0ABT8KPP7_9BACT|nr:DUF4091 domain-containing protein [Fulvivirgaceae bacterium BMA10]
MRIFTIIIALLFVTLASCDNKQRNTELNQETENNFQYIRYEEPADPSEVKETAWNDISEGLTGSFASIDKRYDRSVPPKVQMANQWKAYAWKGERIHKQLLLWSASDLGDISFEWGKFSDKDGNDLPVENLKARFVRYLLTDEFAEGCGHRKPQDFAVSLVADAIDEVSEFSYEPKTTRPVWITIDIPDNIPGGKYEGKLVVKTTGGDQLDFLIELTVGNLVLPGASEWSYHLDLWQNPYAVARFHNVEPWSQEHFDYLRPLVEMLANAGQKVITTSITERPWNGQTEDPFGSMIKWTKKKEGDWEFDYAIFDKWVAFAQSCGIKKLINCYSMIPWGNKFIYFNEQKGTYDSLVAEPGTQAYKEHWTPFLKDFAEHLKTKQWFSMTSIAMDERPVEMMEAAIKLVRDVVPDMKVSLAGNYHTEIEADLFDMCVASGQSVPAEVLTKRAAEGKNTTYYTCCVEAYPNNFTFSPPAESTWQGWYAAANGYDGYLRWAYNSWVKNPLTDSRFRSWPAGDTYLVYPEARTSIRFERMREGIQDFEKIKVLKKRLEQLDTEEAKKALSDLETLLNKFQISALADVSAEGMVTEGQDMVNGISKELF